MNQDYTSLAASKRLQEAGIKLETGAFHYISPYDNSSHLVSNNNWLSGSENSIPAYSFSALWRELPELYQGRRKTLMQVEGINLAGYLEIAEGFISGETFPSTNPADALADLHIWLKERKK